MNFDNGLWVRFYIQVQPCCRRLIIPVSKPFGSKKIVKNNAKFVHIVTWASLIWACPHGFPTSCPIELKIHNQDQAPPEWSKSIRTKDKKPYIQYIYSYKSIHIKLSILLYSLNYKNWSSKHSFIILFFHFHILKSTTVIFHLWRVI